MLGYVATQLHERVEPCVSGWDWGYEYRDNVNNPGNLSCHASATAIDYNAPNHANNNSDRYDGFNDEQVGTIYAILAEVQGAVQWGGDYSGTYDPMHFEIIVDAGTLAAVAASLPTNGPAPIPVPLDDLGDDVYQLVRNEDDGSLWAVAPGHFQYLGSGEYVTVGQDCGLITPDEKVTNNRGIDVLKDLVLTGNYGDQPSALVPN